MITKYYGIDRVAICIVAFATFTLTSCGGGFSADEVQTINGGEGEIMRVLSITDKVDTVKLRSKSLDMSAQMVRSADYATLRRRMLATVRNPQNEGVGIAAPQVGVNRRLVAVQRFDKAGEPFEFYINPTITLADGEVKQGMEGCLSVPDIYGSVARPQRITLRYTTERLTDTVEVIEGFTAVIFQHETDHLDGIMFTDRMASASAEQR